MTTHFKRLTHPPGRWLAALASSLVLWGIAYAHGPGPGAGQARCPAVRPLPGGRNRLARLLLNDSDNAVALRLLAAGSSGPVLANAPQASPASEPAPRLVAANMRPQ